MARVGQQKYSSTSSYKTALAVKGAAKGISFKKKKKIKRPNGITTLLGIGGGGNVVDELVLVK